MPYVSPDEALNRAFADLGAVARDMDVDAPSGLGRAMLIGSPRLRVVLLRWPPGHVTLRHRHPGAEEIFLVVEGVARISIGDLPSRRVGPGMLVLAAPDEPHTIEVPADGPGVLLLAAVAPNQDVPDETIESGKAGDPPPGRP